MLLEEEAERRIAELKRLVAEQGEMLRQGRWEVALYRQEELRKRQEELAPLLAAVVGAGKAETAEKLAGLLEEILLEVRRQQSASRILQEELKEEVTGLAAWRRRLPGLGATIRALSSGAGSCIDERG
ncbi:MAG: hypothetical protein ACPLPT_00190 [Moorellales bacterium]